MKEITVSELKARLDQQEQLHIIDVREPDERQEFHIGGIHIPLGNILNLNIELLEDLKDQELIVLCRSGKRSLQACLFLETLGFNNVTNLTGGLLAWQALTKSS